jgi:hypothetical protein
MSITVEPLTAHPLRRLRLARLATGGAGRPGGLLADDGAHHRALGAHPERAGPSATRRGAGRRRAGNLAARGDPRVIDVQVSIITGEPSPAQARAWAALWRRLLAPDTDTRAPEAPADDRGACRD